MRNLWCVLLVLGCSSTTDVQPQSEPDATGGSAGQTALVEATGGSYALATVDPLETGGEASTGGEAATGGNTSSFATGGALAGTGGAKATGGSVSTTAVNCPTGTSGCACFSSGTCGSGLTCGSGKVCSASMGTGGAQGTGGSGQTTCPLGNLYCPCLNAVVCASAETCESKYDADTISQLRKAEYSDILDNPVCWPSGGSPAANCILDGRILCDCSPTQGRWECARISAVRVP